MVLLTLVVECTVFAIVSDYTVLHLAVLPPVEISVVEIAGRIDGLSKTLHQLQTTTNFIDKPEVKTLLEINNSNSIYFFD